MADTLIERLEEAAAGADRFRAYQRSALLKEAAERIRELEAVLSEVVLSANDFSPDDPF